MRAIMARYHGKQVYSYKMRKCVGVRLVGSAGDEHSGAHRAGEEDTTGADV